MKFRDWIIMALMGGFFAAIFLYEADIAWMEEGFPLGFMVTMAGWGWVYRRTSSLHPMYLRDNPGPGLVRLAVWLGMAWCVFTVFFFGSERIYGGWYLYYLLIGLGTIMVFGLRGAETFGVRLRIDVYERKNFGAAMYIAAFVLATAMIYGGSLWGESDPDSFQYGGPFEILPSYEEGGWIIAWFFLMGWLVLFATMKLWFFREKTVSGTSIRRDRSIADARAASLYCLGCAIPITDAVAGDYYGLADSFIGFAVIALPVLAHEVLRPPSADDPRDNQEGWLYIMFGFAAMILSPIISTLLGFR